jgi:hypothetical protein
MTAEWAALASGPVMLGLLAWLFRRMLNGTLAKVDGLMNMPPILDRVEKKVDGLCEKVEQNTSDIATLNERTKYLRPGS